MSYSKHFPFEHAIRQGVSLSGLHEWERGAAVSNCDLQQQASSSRQDPFRNIGTNINDQDSRENGESVTSRAQEKERSNDRVEELDEVEVGNGKRKRQDSASPLSRLIRSCRRSSNH